MLQRTPSRKSENTTYRTGTIKYFTNDSVKHIRDLELASSSLKTIKQSHGSKRTQMKLLCPKVFFFGKSSEK